MTGGYLRAHQRRAAAAAAAATGNQRGRSGNVSGTHSPASTAFSDFNDGPVVYSAHERKSRSVSPTSQTDSYRSSTTTTSTMRSGTSTTVHESRGRSPVQSPGLPPATAVAEEVDWPRSMAPYYTALSSTRHVTEYRHCVAAEPDDVRPSRREREDTHVKLFGADRPDSPRTAAAAYAAAVGGLSPKPPQRHAEDTQATLFGPPDPLRKSKRVHPDTHQSLFGPPPTWRGGGAQQRRSRSCFHDTPDLLRHDPSAGGRSSEDLQAVRGRYTLRHQDTGGKIFGDAAPVPASPSLMPRPPRPDHDIFLIRRQQSASVADAAPLAANPVASP